MADYTMWYRVGTAALTKNSKVVTGTGTYWLAASINPGDMFSVDSVTEYEVQSVDSNTQITLKTAYAGATTSETDYRIVRNFTATMAAQTAANTAALLSDFRRYVDTDMKTIHGKSAYQIACEKGYAGTESQWVESLKGLSAYEVAVANGYTGTAAQWLESLKGNAEEIAALNSRTAILDQSNVGIKNSIYSGKNLGAFTADHLAAIRDGSFEGLGLGDYFTFSGNSHKFYIAAFGYWGGKDIAVIQDTVLTAAETNPYAHTFNAEKAVGTEGEDGYAPSTVGKYYAESNWYNYIRPIFIEKMEALFGEDALKAFSVTVPTAGTIGKATAHVNLSSKAHLPTMGMVYGFDYYGIHWASERPLNASSGLKYCSSRLPLFIYYPALGADGSPCDGIVGNSVWNFGAGTTGQWSHPSYYGGCRPLIRIG